jgi:hypothetical protein
MSYELTHCWPWSQRSEAWAVADEGGLGHSVDGSSVPPRKAALPGRILPGSRLSLNSRSGGKRVAVRELPGLLVERIAGPVSSGAGVSWMVMRTGLSRPAEGKARGGPHSW